MNMKEPLQFSVFPSLLLLVNLVSIRIKCFHNTCDSCTGDAGGVVETFGTFVVGGNLLVGLVVFFILVIIQFHRYYKRF